MKKRKSFKYLASILVFIMVIQYISILIPFINVKAAQTTTDGNGTTWSYVIDNEGNATNVIWESGDVVFDNKIQFPAVLDGHNVISIGNGLSNAIPNSANWTNSQDIEVTFPSGIKEIKASAFAFSCRTSNGSNEVNGNVEKISKVNIPNTLEKIGDNAFKGCSKLININIPQAVTSIGNNAFLYCKKLEEINVDSNNTTYSSDEGVLYNLGKNTLYKYPEGKTSSKYVVPESVTYLSANSMLCENPTVIIFLKERGNMSLGGLNIFNKNVTVKCFENINLYGYLQSNNIPCELLVKIVCQDNNFYNKLKSVASEYVAKADDSNLQLILENEITELDISGSNIKKINGIEKLDKLTRLNASNNLIEDVSPVENMNITDLNLKNQTVRNKSTKK